LNGMNARSGKRIRRGFAACALLLPALALLGCSSNDVGQTDPTVETTSSAVEATAMPEATRPPAPVPVQSQDVTLKVMSFNLLWGAGAERRFDENIPRQLRGRARMPVLMDFLRKANPDVLAIEEAAGWDQGDPSLAKRVADELGMNYVLAPDAWELHVVLLSKYPIVAADYVSRLQDFNGVALRATLAVTPYVDVNVIAVHLNSMSSQTRSCQLEALLDMASGLKGRTVLLGDMNFRPGAPQADTLASQGWQLVAAQEQWPIDQIWLDPEANVDKGRWWDAVDEPAGVSDHLPVGVDVTLAAPMAAAANAREPVGEPGVLDYACPLPQ
jgi:endonuclease/exonuclease/phosphatase family metal-dependent hydrolase